MAGRGEEMKGGLKETAGRVFGDEDLEAEGAAQKSAGKAERETSGAVNEAKGSVKKGVGKLVDSPSMEAEGEADKMKGKAERLG